MARFDALRLTDGAVVLDCQADVLRNLRTRFVVPLFPLATSRFAADRLNPLLDLPDGRYVMGTQGAGTIHVREIAGVIASLSDAESRIMNALDMLLTGF
ncbi:MAG: CcdB family protein [Alphaproteobacteria bacterium]|nr:CcdB family protein [Alphaproteobacteria bacterium]